MQTLKYRVYSKHILVKLYAGNKFISSFKLAI